MNGALPPLPLGRETETPAILRQLIASHRALAELKGSLGHIPNRNILINTLSLQEARDSSEIENIVTTQDELFSGDAAMHVFHVRGRQRGSRLCPRPARRV